MNFIVQLLLMSTHINIVPKLSSNNKHLSKHLEKKTDPDVNNILSKDEIDIMGMKHEPTDEEKTSITNQSKSYSWLIIGLVIVVVILIIGIAWYVLKDNKKCKNIPNISSEAIRPNIHPAYQYGHPMHPINRPQTENLPISTNSMPKRELSQNKFSQPKPQPTKQELMSTLNRLNSIEEVNEESDEESSCDKIVEIKEKKKLKLSKSKNKLKDKPPKEEENAEDDVLANNFYNKLQENLEDDEDNSDGE